MQAAEFSSKIITWYRQNHRDLPWRKTQDPYKIWLSEIILQQTRVKQGLPYYERFLAKYPRIEDLAAAPDDEVLRVWQGLGYYSRARNLLHTARYIAQERKGKFPESYAELLKLKGVGEYTAAAIASFAFGEAVAVLDGNVYRVLARVFGIESNIAAPATKKEFSQLAQELISPQEPADHNQAIMEFGAQLCSPQKPNCLFCPLKDSCQAYRLGKQKDLPLKIRKKSTKKRYLNYLVFQKDDKIALRLRDSKGIWPGLYEFYFWEDKTLLEIPELLAAIPFSPELQKHWEIQASSPNYKHVLSHQSLMAKFHRIEVENESDISELFPEFTFFALPKVESLPKPILLSKYLDKYFF